ncbi:MAG TPA: hypothetical protein VND93_21980, partial [Myxococcales bacterium]|nr:hypothetical protein [Myxococcales bacterium]
HLYQPSRYTENRGAGQVLVLPSGTGQMAGIRPLADGVNDYLAQNIEVPKNRYCMLTFSHGFHLGPGCHEELQSKLALDIVNAVDLPTAWYHSSETLAGDRLTTERLRFLTADNWSGDNVWISVRFQNRNDHPECEALLDDVSVRCAR